VGLGDESMHWLIASISCETGVSPTELMGLDSRMLWTMNRYLVSKSQASQRKPGKR